MSTDHEWQFHIATDVYWVKNGNYTLLLTSTGHEWQFDIATDVYLVQERQFHIASEI